MKKYFILCCGIGLFLSSVAEVCPTVEAIQHNQLDGWQAFDSDDGEPLSGEVFSHYQSGLYGFAEADYYQDAPEGPAQCYYASSFDPYYGNAYLAKQSLQPDFSQVAWQWDGAFHAKCAEANQENCLFVAGLQGGAHHGT